MSVTPSTLGLNATIGILGGGQLGRMLAMAAAKLGLRCHIYCPDAYSPAFDVVRRVTQADYADHGALDRFASEVDVVTFEFENVPAESAAFLADRVAVLPDPRVLALTQDRLVEKNSIIALGIPTADFAEVDHRAMLDDAIARVGLPAVLKTRRFGYDGKGQAKIGEDTDRDWAWAEIGKHPAVLETFVDFEREISVVAARSRDGKVECFDVTENEHREHILKVSRAPARIPSHLVARARQIAETIAAAFDYVGVLAVEMFVVPGENGPSLLVNEIAPRVHNSGHWTLDGCSVSQFEQHIRAVAGWPLATPVIRGRVEMVNLIGEEVGYYTRLLELPGASIHLYGKNSIRAGRKMGHLTRVLPDQET